MLTVCVCVCVCMYVSVLCLYVVWCMCVCVFILGSAVFMKVHWFWWAGLSTSSLKGIQCLSFNDNRKVKQMIIS